MIPPHDADNAIDPAPAFGAVPEALRALCAEAMAGAEPAALMDMGGRILAANTPGLVLRAVPALAALAARTLARRGADAHLEKLRLPGRLTPVTFACSRVEAGGRRAVLLRALDAGPARPLAAAPMRAAADAATPPSSALPSASRPSAATEGIGARFTWRSDAQGRLEAVDAVLARLLGRTPQELAGRRWEELGASAAQAALAAGTSFAHCPARLPDASGGLVEVELGAMPARTPGTTGMVGYGVVKAITPAGRTAARPSPAPPPAAPEREPAAPAPAAPEASAPVPLQEPSARASSAPAAPVPPLEAPAPDSAGEMLRPILSVVPPSPNVVPLRGGEAARGEMARDAARVSWEGLSTGERNAFREIARALGARIEGMEFDPLDGERTDADAPAEADATGEDAADETTARDPDVGPPPATDSVPPQAVDLPPPEPAPPAAEAPPIVAPPVVLEPPAPSPAAASIDGLRRALAAGGLSATPRSAAGGERAVLDRLPYGLIAYRGDRLLYANRALLDWTGHADLATIQASGGLAALFGEAREGEDGATVSLLTRTGAPIAVEARLMSAPWEDGPAMLYLLRRVTGVTDERVRQAELALRQSEATARELRAILDTATDGVVLIDAAGVILSMNRPAEALFGFEAGEVQGESFTLLFAPESQRAAVDYLDGLASNGVASVLNDGREVIGRVREGGLIPLFMTIGRVGEDAAKFCAVLRDITQWKRAEEELTEAKRLAERANLAKSDFLAKISHEIRTPLNAIIGFSEVMMEERFGPIENQRYRDYLRDIHASGGHLVSLINDLLDLSKIEAGKLDLSFTSVALNEIVQQSMAIMQPQANRERIIIRSSLAADLPPVVADARSIRQIILNLVSNSVKFTKPGGQVILSTALTHEGEVVLRVRDTGIGMSESDIAIAMEPFRQLATSGRSGSGGTGLGLPLTKALAEANRATFSIRSAVDSGTLVEITFPSTRVLAE